MSEAQAIAALRRSAKRRERAIAERQNAADELRQRVQDAHLAGVGATRIAELVGVSRQAIYEAIGHPTPDQPS